LNPEFLLQGTNESVKKIHHGGIARQDQPPDLGIYDGAEDDRTLTCLILRVVDMLEGIPRLPHRIDKGQRRFLEVDVVELNQETVTERLGRDRRAVGDKENGSLD
jgi:hypothetical protein